MFYGYHQALCLQRQKGGVFMDSGSWLHYPYSSEITSCCFFNSPTPLLTPNPYPSVNKAAVFCKEKGKNNLNLNYIKGTKWTDFQPRIVSKWMIIWLISEINNNNCLSLLIRTLNSKWNSSAEFQWAGFTAQDLGVHWGEKKKTQLYLAGVHCVNPRNQKSKGNEGGFRICKGDGLGHRGNISGFLPCLGLYSTHPSNESCKHRTLGPERRISNQQHLT